MCPSPSQNSPSSSQAVCLPIFIFKYLQNSKILIFKNEPLKHLSTINNSPNLPNQPKLTFTYPLSVSSLPPPQPQPSTSPLKQSSFHRYPPSQNSLRIFQWNANGICFRRTELIQFLSLNKYDLIFLQESLLSSDSTFHVLGYKTLKKNCSMTRRGTTDSTENLGNLTYSPLSTQHLSSLDPSSTYLAIAVKIKGASPIHLLNIYVTPICSFFCGFSPFLLPSSLLLTFSAILLAITHTGTFTSQRTN